MIINAILIKRELSSMLMAHWMCTACALSSTFNDALCTEHLS